MNLKKEVATLRTELNALNNKLSRICKTNREMKKQIQTPARQTVRRRKTRDFHNWMEEERKKILEL